MTDDAAAYRRIPLEVFNEGKLEVIEEVVAEDYVEHTVIPGMPPTRDGFAMFVAGLLEAFPDFRYEILEQTQDGDLHLGYIRGSATMSGDFMGMPATGKSASWEEMHLGRMENGKLTEHWAVIDQLGMMQQLGLAPSPPAS